MFFTGCILRGYDALQREMHWRRTYASDGFHWDTETWNDGECQRLLHWPRAWAEKLGRLFFLPAMQSAPGTNGVELLQHDSDGNPVWVARNKARFPLMEVVAVFLMRMSAECKWSRLAPALGGRHWSGYKLVFGEMLTLLYDFWFDRLTFCGPSPCTSRRSHPPLRSCTIRPQVASQACSEHA